MKHRITVLLLALACFALLFSPRLWQVGYPWPYREQIEARAAEFDVDPHLVAAVIRVESSFDPQARSGRGAVGLMQLMPETARWAAASLGLEYDADRLADPEYSLHLGTWYLATLHREFDGRLPLVLAAYNGGHGKVLQWMEEEMWDGSWAKLYQIPFPETRQYVQRVTRDYYVYQFLY